MVTTDKKDNLRFTVPGGGWFYIWLIMWVGDPDIIDSIIEVIKALSSWIGRL
jgi:hypothetical protein